MGPVRECQIRISAGRRRRLTGGRAKRRTIRDETTTIAAGAGGRAIPMLSWLPEEPTSLKLEAPTEAAGTASCCPETSSQRDALLA